MRFLFTSGYVGEKSGWTEIKQRGWKCLVKPCPANELLAAVDEVLAADWTPRGEGKVNPNAGGARNPIM